MVEGVGLVAFSFQFFTRLAAVFAEEVGGFFTGIIQLLSPQFRLFDHISDYFKGMEFFLKAFQFWHLPLSH